MKMTISEMNVAATKTIALFSGSFNPIHQAHTGLAKFLIDNCYADEVWFVISPSNPLKNQSLLIDEYIRLEMLLLAIADCSKFKASDIEFTLPRPSYTIDTLTELSKQYPTFKFKLIIGSDNALVFKQWKKYDEIVANFEILVYPRKGYDFDKIHLSFPQMKLLNTPILDISSTMIRDGIKNKLDVTHLLHPAVYQFIVENDLYK